MIRLLIIFTLGLLLGGWLLHHTPKIWQRWQRRLQRKRFKFNVLQEITPTWGEVNLDAQIPPSTKVITSAVPAPLTDNHADVVQTTIAADHAPLTLELVEEPTAMHNRILDLDEDVSHRLSLPDDETKLNFEPVSAPHRFQIKKQGDAF